MSKHLLELTEEETQIINVLRNYRRRPTDDMKRFVLYEIEDYLNSKEE